LITEDAGQLPVAPETCDIAVRLIPAVDSLPEDNPMGKIQDIERQIAELSAEEFAELRSRIISHDEAAWDEQITRDVASGRLRPLSEAALRAAAAGNCTEL
jgi:hypothetical protein